MSGLIIAANSSFAGKTTTTLALLAYWKSLGLVVAPGKVGPDFIDASYLSHLANYPCANLDMWMHGARGVANIYERMTLGARSPDICLIEACMGLFDGGVGSAASLAKALDLPVLLLLNVEGLAESALALAQGYLNLGLSQGLRFLGLILTKVGTLRHIKILKGALEPYLASLNLPLFGFLPKASAPTIKSRHLGLVSVDESLNLLEDAKLIPWLTANCDLTSLNRLVLGEKRPKLQESQDLPVNANWPQEFFPPRVTAYKLKRAKPTLAIALDQAFSFCYADLPAFLAELGLNIVYFSPLKAKNLPPCQGVYLPGGYPELYLEELANNLTLIADLKRFANSGHLIYGECGGFIYLLASLTLTTGETYPLANLLPAKAYLNSTRQALGYREARLTTPVVDCAREICVRGHEFHYSSVQLAPNADHSLVKPLWQIKDLTSETLHEEGLVCGQVFGSYLHLSSEGGAAFWQALAKTLQRVVAA